MNVIERAIGTGRICCGATRTDYQYDRGQCIIHQVSARSGRRGVDVERPADSLIALGARSGTTGGRADRPADRSSYEAGRFRLVVCSLVRAR